MTGSIIKTLQQRILRQRRRRRPTTGTIVEGDGQYWVEIPGRFMLLTGKNLKMFEQGKINLGDTVSFSRQKSGLVDGSVQKITTRQTT